MKYHLSITLFIFCQGLVATDQQSSFLRVSSGIRNETVISVDSQVHIDYGLSYPVTYEFYIPLESTSLRSYRKFHANQDWTLVEEKTENDFFNGVNAVRFDYTQSVAYVSIGFSDDSDSIFIKITEDNENNLETYYLGISKYYDNRNAVVTSTADDWAGWVNEKFVQTCQIFRSYNLWLSCAIVTNVGDPNTWVDIQTQIDSGYIEPISHSRTHPYAPYADLEGEVLGSKQDLIDNLNMPEYNRYGDHEYVYAWVAPYGEYDDAIDSIVSVGKYLVTRMYYGNDHTISTWNQESFKYDPIGVSTEAGPLWLGSTDTNYLNNTFNDVLDSGGVYHIMCHPNVIEWDQDYPWVHLEHISNRKNIWYTGFGHLYAYHFLQSTYPEIILNTYISDNIKLDKFILYPNYPNPFNPTTTIKYNIPSDSFVKITIYNQMGGIVKNLYNSQQNEGYNSIIWNSKDNYGKPVSAGLYFYSIESVNYKLSGKMVLVK
jgi:hypothetical protein